MDLVVSLLQAFAALVASAVATRIVRRLWRHQRALHAADRLVAEVEAEIAWLVARGEAEYSRRDRTVRTLAATRLRREFPRLTEREADSLILKAATRRRD